MIMYTSIYNLTIYFHLSIITIKFYIIAFPHFDYAILFRSFESTFKITFHVYSASFNNNCNSVNHSPTNDMSYD